MIGPVTKGRLADFCTGVEVRFAKCTDIKYDVFGKSRKKIRVNLGVKVFIVYCKHLRENYGPVLHQLYKPKY